MVSDKKNHFLNGYHEINIVPQVTSLIIQPSSQKNPQGNVCTAFILQTSEATDQLIDHHIEESRSVQLLRTDLRGG